MTVFTSPYGGVAIRNISITQRVFQGMPDPEVVVMVDGPSGREYTAGQLFEGVHRFAGGLAARGLGKGDCVAIMAPNIPEFFIAFHGTAWAGGTVTTVNPTYTAAELNYQLKDASAKILVTIAPFLDIAREGVAGTGVAEIVLIGPGAEGATGLADFLGDAVLEQVPVDPAHDILVLPYSSGTTGLPKGVMLTHRNLVANVEQIQAVRPIDKGEWTVGFLPFFHIYGMTVLMNLYLGQGGGVVTMPRFDLELFLRLCQTHHTKQAFCVPPVVLALAKHPMVDNFDLSDLKYVFSGAAPLGAPLSKAVSDRLGVKCEQGYGMTELSPVSHLSPHGRGRAGAVGLIAPCTECRVVDPVSGQDLGVGEEGEIWVKGPQVMVGYLNNAKATAESMTPDGWLKTGDIGLFDQDGYLFIRDRLKELIKVKGFQVAPAEVEAQILSCPGVADAAVIGIPDEESGEVPMAFIVAAPGASPTEDQIAAHLDERLAHYKRVRAFRFVDTIPKSPSGKILRRVLKAQVTG